jgi:hypothetical protein
MEGNTVACALASGAYVAPALVALESALEHTRDIESGVLFLVDDTPPASIRPDRVRLVQIADVVPIEKVRELQFVYSPFEFAAALKPVIIGHLLRSEGTHRVVYVDADTVTVGDFGAFISLLADAAIVLCPHYTTPTFGSHGVRRDKTLLSYGCFNAGVLAVSRGAEGLRFIEWWAERTLFHGRQAPAEHEYVDQRWLDFVPILFPSASIHGLAGINIGHWNLHELDMDQRGMPHHRGQDVRLLHMSNVNTDPQDVVFRGELDSSDAVVQWWSKTAEEYRERVARRKLDLPPLQNSLPCYSDGSAIPSSHRRHAYAARQRSGSLECDPYVMKRHFARTHIRESAIELRGLVARGAQLLKQMAGSLRRLR